MSLEDELRELGQAEVPAALVARTLCSVLAERKGGTMDNAVLKHLHIVHENLEIIYRISQNEPTVRRRVNDAQDALDAARNALAKEESA